MEGFRFYKEDEKWYIDLPGWEGSKDDLQMVAGADEMLDVLSDKGDNVIVEFGLTEYSDTHCLSKIQDGEEEGGAYYHLYDNLFSHITSVWLCDVTKEIYGYMPKKIYFRLP